MDISEEVLVCIVSFCFIILIVIMAIVISIPDLNQSNTTEYKCSPQQCRVDLTNFVKTCPEGNEQLTYNPITQGCTDPQGCNNPNIPCVYFPGSDQGSICPTDPDYTGLCTNCTCVNRKICPSWASVSFHPVDVENTTILEQRDYSLINGVVKTGVPLSVGEYNNITGVCGLTAEQLPFMWPPQCVIGNMEERNGLYYCVNQ